MSKPLIDWALALPGSARSLRPGTYLFHQDDPVRAVFIVVDGMVELTRHQRDGTAFVLQRAGPASVLAEASVYADAYHCDGLVRQPTTVHQIPQDDFRARLRADPGRADIWAAYLARAVQTARSRSEILSRHTVAGRLDGWLAWHDGTLPRRGEWHIIAAEIGVSPEALYRELAKRRT